MKLITNQYSVDSHIIIQSNMPFFCTIESSHMPDTCALSRKISSAAHRVVHWSVLESPLTTTSLPACPPGDLVIPYYHPSSSSLPFDRESTVGVRSV
jgi:hypothetical protein